MRYRTSVAIELDGLGTIIPCMSVFLRVYIGTCITWNNRLHVTDGPSFPSVGDCKSTLPSHGLFIREGFPFGITHPRQGCDNLVVISDKTEKTPGESHFRVESSFLWRFMRR